MQEPKSRLPRALSFLSCASMALLCLASSQTFGQAPPNGITYSIPHTGRSPDIDGVFSGGEWAAASHYELSNETDPGQNIPAPFHTDVYLMEDGKNFLVAFVAQDPDPTKLRAFYRDRDKAFPDDRVGVVLDTFNDGRRAFEFWSNALGSQVDQINDDVARFTDNSWNAIWDSAGNITETGYVVEMKIPLNQLRFASDLPIQTWGINLLRVHQRDVWQKMTDMQYDYNRSCYLCQIPKGQGFPDLQQTTNIRIIPTLTSAVVERRPNPVTDTWQRDAANTEAGADLRWAINDGMILNATLNPDFSQVEADQAQLDVNSTFALYFPEKREFFLDGAEYFNTVNTNVGFGSGQTRLIYTRNISDPDYGVKLTGKEGNHTYGILAANDARTGFIIPGSQGSQVATLANTQSKNMALRYRYDVGGNLTVGVLGTARQADDYSNTVTQADLNWQATGTDRIATKVMHSNSSYPLAIQTAFGQLPELSDTSYSVAYNHKGNNWFWNAAVSDYGKDFRADLGFVNKVNIREQLINPGYTWRRGPSAFFNTIGAGTQWSKVTDESGQKISETRIADLWVNGPMQYNAEIYLEQGDRFYNGRSFDTGSVSLWNSFNPWNGVTLDLNVTSSDTIDFSNTQAADSLTISPGFNIQLGRHLQAQLRYSRQRLEVAGGTLYTSNLADLRITWQFTNNSFIKLVLINSDTDRNPALYSFKIDAHSRDLSSQLLYSYRFNAQTRFFIGYSDSSIANDLLPQLQATYRTAFGKFTYAWQY